MEKKHIKAQYYARMLEERQQYHSNSNSMTYEERWQRELKLDPENDFLKNLVQTNYGVSPSKIN